MMKQEIRRILAYIILAVSFGMTLMLARALRARRDRRGPTGRILVTGTFYNRGWFLSHIEPLARCGANTVLVVTDASQPAPDRVTIVFPSRRMLKWLGRAAAKLIVMIKTGRSYRPDIYMGYHLFPGAMSALIAARMLGRPSVYQMTGGPIEVLGGGYTNENALMSSLSRPSAFLEKLALAVVREFDLVVVRGRQARRFLAEHRIDRNVVVITGSVHQTNGVSSSRSIDLIFVGRLAPIKQPEQFVEIVAKLVEWKPTLRAVMVGGGPLLESLRNLAGNMGISSNIEFMGQRHDVHELLQQAKVFVLTSQSEGLSISLIEAMSCGVPGVVANVGELSDIVIDDVNGWLVPGNDMDYYVRRIRELLDDQNQWQVFSSAARQAALELSGVERVAQRWRSCLEPFECVQGPVVTT